MSYYRRRAVVVPLALLLAAPTCGESAEAKQARKEIQDAIDATGKLLVHTWEDLQRKAAPELAAARTKLAELRDEIESRGATVAGDAKELARRAEQQLAAAAEVLARAGRAGSESAETAWRSFRQAVAEAGDSIAKAKDELGGKR